MKKTLLSILLSCCLASLMGAETMKEDFYTLKNGTSYNGEVTLATGIWQMSGVTGNVSSGVTRDGRLYILNDGRWFDLMGIRMER